VGKPLSGKLIEEFTGYLMAERGLADLDRR
jgi:hypothetical protein